MDSAVNLKSKDNLKSTLRAYNQEHLLKFWDEINDDQKATLAREIRELDLEEITKYFQKATSSVPSSQVKIDERLAPIPQCVRASVATSSASELESYRNIGLQEISNGKVAVVLMAGGQGTRLGVSYPKGMYNVGLPSQKSLFQLQAERILRLERMALERHGKPGRISWFVLTSEATMEPTRTYFREQEYFGLQEENVLFFEQGMLPCFDFDGKVLLDQKHRISRAPDGNGGIYRALKLKGMLEEMQRRGIRSVHVHSVDNILIKIADPIFIGFCVSRGADCAAKTVEKTVPTEAVGVICQVDGSYQVVEYSEITQETAAKSTDDGKLLFNAGNICNHYFTKDFLLKVADMEMKLHVARKKIPHIDETGSRKVPDKVNGIKIEKFVFDVFEFAENFAVLEVSREEEFSALKNSDKEGKDCPSTARSALLELHKKWLRENGAKLVNGPVEISPLRSYSGENLDVDGESFEGPYVLE